MYTLTRILNNIFVKPTILAFGVLCFYSQGAFTDDHTTHLDAHVHGDATLQIVLQEHKVDVQFTSPAMNIVGFEHKALTSEHKSLVSQAQSQLENVDTLLSFNKNLCQKTKASVDVSTLNDSNSPSHHDKKHNESHKHHESTHFQTHHDKKHNHSDHKPHHCNTHNDKHDKPQKTADSHSEITAHYQFDCKATPTELSVDAFTAFSSIETVQVIWITPSQQGAATLTTKNRRLRFKR